MFTSLRNNDQL